MYEDSKLFTSLLKHLFACLFLLSLAILMWPLWSLGVILCEMGTPPPTSQGCRGMFWKRYVSMGASRDARVHPSWGFAWGAGEGTGCERGWPLQVCAQGLSWRHWGAMEGSSGKFLLTHGGRWGRGNQGSVEIGEEVPRARGWVSMMVVGAQEPHIPWTTRTEQMHSESSFWISLITNIYILSSWISSLEKCLFKFIAHFKWVICLFLLNCKSPLYIIDTNPLSDALFKNIFTYVCMAESLHYSPETITLLIGYTPMQNKKFKKIFFQILWGFFPPFGDILCNTNVFNFYELNLSIFSSVTCFWCHIQDAII